jgi:hypothetical protein
VGAFNANNDGTFLKALDFGKKKKKKKVKEDLFKETDEVTKAAEAVAPAVDYHKEPSVEPKAEGEADAPETEEIDFGKKKTKKTKVKFDEDQNIEIEVMKL